ncbi:MAG: SAM-dependent methyltransferase [Muribaculum sp.]|nr:SAM-dependent methyltransferase [Muribaculum sp.]
MKRTTFNKYLDRRDFGSLFISELGWNNPVGMTKLPPIEVDGIAYNVKVLAQRSGFRILTCEVESIPPTSVCRRIDIRLRQYANEYILIFISKREETHHLWLAPVKKVDKRDIVTAEYKSADQAEFIFQKIDNLTFGFNEVTTIVDVRERVQSSFMVNSERITKDFYAGFKKEHKAFANFIKGIDGTATAESDRQWYASVMLNRLMFCYFIQKKGFLNNETDYLRKRFDAHVAGEKDGTFFRSFYLDFLRSLFTDGLNDPRHSRDFEKKFGRIPYLNGGMFDTHKIERDYAGIDIEDDAFDRLFAFFDKWNWHLDTRITASGKDINPDVLGYIFEQYINDRAAMGAYYTKEDITEYIGRNCILPFLFDATKNSTAESAKYFAEDGYVWTELRESGDKYIFDAVKHGYDEFDEIPENIRKGIITESMRHEYSELPVGKLPANHVPLAELRKDWNTRTPERWGLPTEIWRETIERLQRCGTIIEKISKGEITSINDFITYNLDIRQFAQDILAKADHHFAGWFYHALQKVTILDPTCGSGAFLFAALNILEPLYEICIDRMQDFNRENPLLFVKELGEISDKYRSNIQYFIFKSIILRNLYGADIMVEATEIAKLRLFLKMVAVVDVDRRAENMGIDPLPDIDFNIRCGNTLVGYANEKELDRDLSNPKDILEELANQEFRVRIKEEMEKVKDAYNLFRKIQLEHGDDMASFKKAKEELRERLAVLNEQLNRRLHAATSALPYDKWLETHQPFNWLAEFYGIIQGNGGFDVIIGNPPYVEISVALKKYSLYSYKTESCGNLYACVLERCTYISNNQRIGMIVQLPICCTDRMNEAQKILKSRNSWFLTFDDRPGKLFDGLQHIRATIFIMQEGSGNIYSSKYNRWYSESRGLLFQNLCCVNSSKAVINGTIAKKQYRFEDSIIDKISAKDALSKCLFGTSTLYSHTAPQYFTRITTFQPHFWNEKDGEKLSVSIKPYSISPHKHQAVCAILNSNLFYWWFILLSDCRHLNKREIERFPILPIEGDKISILDTLCRNLMEDYQNNSNRKLSYLKTSGKIEYDEFFPKYSKPIIDEIDRVLAEHYGFTEEELDFIINYDIKYRMGDELNAEE